MKPNGDRSGQPRRDVPEGIIVAPQRAVWELVKEYIEEQIVLERFPPGSWLPSVRDLSAQLGLNRNTISKAYQALGREGTVTAKQGVGVLVARRPVIEHHTTERLTSLIAAVIDEAKRAGMDDAQLLQQIESELARISHVRELRVAFIECSPEDTRKMSQHLSRHLDVPITAVDLNDFLSDPARYAREYDILSTTFFHLQEISGAAAEFGQEVVGLHHAPSHESVLELARLPSNWTIGLICINTRTEDKVSRVIRMYSRCAILPALVDDEAAVARVMREADLIVDTVQTHEAVAGREGAPPAITLDFQTEQQSVEYLRHRIHELINNPVRRKPDSSTLRKADK